MINCIQPSFPGKRQQLQNPTILHVVSDHSLQSVESSVDLGENTRYDSNVDTDREDSFMDSEVVFG